MNDKQNGTTKIVIAARLSIDRLLHFERVAELLNLSQPALSKQISLLESELDAPLFLRDRHGVKVDRSG